MKKLLNIIFLLLTIFTISGCAPATQKQDAKPAAPAVYTVTAPREGKVLGLIAEKGERIGQGQPLFAIEDAQTDGEVKNLATQLAKAQAELHRMEAGTPVNTPAADISAIQARVAAAQQKAAKMNDLYAQGAVSRMQAQMAQAELDNALLSLQAASQAVASIQPASPESIEQQKKIIAALEAQQKSALAKQEQNEAVSPCTGIITEVHVTNGTAVAKDQPIIEIKAEK